MRCSSPCPEALAFGKEASGMLDELVQLFEIDS